MLSCNMFQNTVKLYDTNTTTINPALRKFSTSQDMLGPEQAYEGLYGQGPPSVHSSHGGRAFQQGTYVVRP